MPPARRWPIDGRTWRWKMAWPSWRPWHLKEDEPSRVTLNEDNKRQCLPNLNFFSSSLILVLQSPQQADMICRFLGKGAWKSERNVQYYYLYVLIYELGIIEKNHGKNGRKSAETDLSKDFAPHSPFSLYYINLTSTRLSSSILRSVIKVRYKCGAILYTHMVQ